ncbi:hypothetical protein [Streptomyces malaysiensis]|uniref:Uncharacterized protein n=2 Tax=Streptomyces malaysiensis TaxID=92644 RepID=A0A9X2RVZ4_STRMQ|nr:hypothetical protein [Streptomyces samsunensis]MCQ8832752.1 hypothetical protein [Streptomyces samsunensis]
MAREIVHSVTITGDSIRPGDVISVGGIPHAVADVREIAGNRKRLQFVDGNAYFLPRSLTIEVTRIFTPHHVATQIRRSATASRIPSTSAQNTPRPLDVAGRIR